MLWIVIVLAVAIAFGQYVRRQAEKLRAEEGNPLFRGSAAEARQRPHVVVKIAIKGNIASRDEVHKRMGIEDEIERQKIGAVADAGSGKGEMHLLVVAAGGDSARTAEAIRDLLAAAGMLERSTIETG